MIDEFLRPSVWFSLSILNNGLIYKIATTFYTSPQLNYLYYYPCLLLSTYASPCLQVVISDLSTTPSLCRSIPCTSQNVPSIPLTVHMVIQSTQVYCIGECVSIWNNSEHFPIDTSPSCIRFPLFSFQGTCSHVLRQRIFFFNYGSQAPFFSLSVPLTMAIL